MPGGSGIDCVHFWEQKYCLKLLNLMLNPEICNVGELVAKLVNI